jgi:PAS domain S-box-containing protein
MSSMVSAFTSSEGRELRDPPMTPSSSSGRRRYLIALAIVAVATIIRILLDPILESSRSLVTYLPTIMIVAWYCGSGPTLMATLLSCGAAMFLFLEPRYSLVIHSSRDQVSIIIFLTFGLTAVFFSEQLHRAKERGEWRQRDMENERALLASERRFRQLADAMPQMVWSREGTGQLTYCNQRWYEYTGLPRESAAADWLAVIHSEDLPAFQAAWREAFEFGHAFQAEYRLKHCRTGEYRWHLGRAEPVRDLDGNIVQWYGTSTDIDDRKRIEVKLRQTHNELEKRVAERTAELTQVNIDLSREVEERRVAEARLRESEELFQAFMDQLPACAWIVDQQNRVLFINRCYSELTGMAQQSILGKTAFEVYPPSIAAQYHENNQVVMETGRRLEVVEPYLRPDGTQGDILVVKFPITEQNDQPRMGGVAIDITPLKQAEARARQLAAQLACAEDTERRRLATDLHDSIGQHLSLLKINLESLVQKLGQDAKDQGFFDNTVRLLDNVIKQTRTLMFDLYPSMLSDLGLVPTLSWYCEQLGAQTQVSISEIGQPQPLPGPMSIYLYRASKELLCNAMRHGRAKDIVVTVHWRREALKLVIDDDGCGFDPATDLAPQTQHGLGLAGIRERLLAFCGKMFIESKPGQGTRIAMEVPLASSATDKVA